MGNLPRPNNNSNRTWFYRVHGVLYRVVRLRRRPTRVLDIAADTKQPIIWIGPRVPKYAVDACALWLETLGPPTATPGGRALQ